MTIRTAVLAFLVSFTAITVWLLTRQPADINFSEPPLVADKGFLEKQSKPAMESEDEDDIIALSDGERYLREKLKGIVIAEVEFENTTLEEALDYLRLRARELDPAEDDSGKGIGFVIRKPAIQGDDDWDTLDVDAVPTESELTVTGRMENKNLAEILDFICLQTAHRWELTDRKILLTPLD